MADRFFFDIELPDLASSPAAPEAGFIQHYGLNGRPAARNSGGRVFEHPRLYVGASERPEVLKIWTGTASTNGDGQVTVDYSAAGFTQTPNIQFAPNMNTGTQQDRCFAGSIMSASVTSATLQVLRGQVIIAILIGGAQATRPAPSGINVHVLAVGV